MDEHEADFAKPYNVVRALEEAPNAEIVVNAAACTAVDKAENGEVPARAINATTVGLLARACAAKNIPPIHISTDYVYGGEKPEAYVETDATTPLCVYGRTKLAGVRFAVAALEQINYSGNSISPRCRL